MRHHLIDFACRLVDLSLVGFNDLGNVLSRSQYEITLYLVGNRNFSLIC